jgi:hypothetical protein
MTHTRTQALQELACYHDEQSNGTPDQWGNKPVKPNRVLETWHKQQAELIRSIAANAQEGVCVCNCAAQVDGGGHSHDCAILDPHDRAASTTPQPEQAQQSGLTKEEIEWLDYAVCHMRDDSEPEDLTCADVLERLLNRTTTAAQPEQVRESLLRPASEALLAGCYCKPGKCMAPTIMGRQQPCRDPAKATITGATK